MIERSTTGVSSLRRHVGDEAAVDLDGVEGKALEVGERRKAGAEIVERKAGTRLLQLREGAGGGVRVLHDDAFGQFELERKARGFFVAQDGRDVVEKFLAEELARRRR